MIGPRRTPALPTRAAAAALLAASCLGMGGCAFEGAVIDSQDRGYWYQDHNCR
jgi:hypothetical protein